jgi:hypothetical protein
MVASRRRRNGAVEAVALRPPIAIAVTIPGTTKIVLAKQEGERHQTAGRDEVPADGSVESCRRRGRNDVLSAAVSTMNAEANITRRAAPTRARPAPGRRR